MTLQLDIRDNLKEVINDRGYIKAVIARKANMSPCKLSAVLTKTRKLEANELFNLCDAMGVTPVEVKDYKKVNVPDREKEVV